MRTKGADLMITMILCVLFMTLIFIIIRFIWKYIERERLFSIYGLKINQDSYLSLNKEYFLHLKNCDINIQTIEDLEVNQVFDILNRTYTDVGREYMYGQLFIKNHQHDLLEHIITQLKNQKILKKTIYELFQLSRNYSESLQLFDDMSSLSKLDMILICSLTIVPFILLGLYFPLGNRVFTFFPLWIIVQVSSYLHFEKKTKHTMSYVLSFCYLVETLRKLNHLKLFDEETSKLVEEKISHVLHYTWIHRCCAVIEKIDVYFFIEIVKCLFSLPIYQYYLLIHYHQKCKDDYFQIYEYVGMVDMAVSLSSLRQEYQTCIPQMSQEPIICFQNIYHPVLKNPVKNTLSIQSSCMITGSNASGKSTFLKTIGFNMLMAEAYHTCFADEFIYYQFHLCTSIHMKDVIESGDSYYVKEIKILKNIIDMTKSNQCLILIDEILKGTNERERLIIAKAILNYLFHSQSIVMVTTHDIMLVRYFEDIDQYCFNDYISNQELKGDYKIQKGICEVGNAIALLKLYGFDNEILDHIHK